MKKESFLYKCSSLLFCVFVLFYSLALSQQYIPDANTVLLLHMNETSGGTVADSSGNGNNGTATGTTIVDGKFGKARSFNGSTDYISVPDNSVFNFGNSDFTIECWVKFNGTPVANATFFSQSTDGVGGNTQYMQLLSGNNVWFQFYDLTGSLIVSNFNSWTPAANTWYHIAIVRSGTSWMTFINGVKQSAVTTANVTYPNYTGAFVIGALNQNGIFSNFHSGIIDEVRISNKARQPWEFNYPVVKGVFPKQNELNVVNYTNIADTFNVKMNAGTINSNTMLVYGSQSGKHIGEFNWNNDSTIFTFNPSNVDFKEGEIVTVTLTKNILSALGDTLTNGYHWSFTIATSPSTGTFAAKVDLATGINPFSVFSHDIDNDGDADLVTANNGSDNVSIYKNNGDGTFQTKVNYGAKDQPWSVFVDDLNQDGYGDIVVSNNNANNVSVLINNSDGTFQPDIIYSTAVYPTSVFVYDLDGDGDKDVAVACITNGGGGKISILKNNGNGTFQSNIDYDATNPISIFIADIDADGDGDIASANSVGGSTNISILKNNGDGTFQSKVDWTTGSVPYAVCISDLDGDGDNDLAVANHSSNNISILKNNGDGTFQTKVDYPVGGNTFAIFSSDVDGDGDADLAVTKNGDNFISIFLNNNDGTFPIRVDYETGDSPRSVFISDIDSDGDGDITIVNYGSSTLSILKNIANVTAISPTQNALNVSPSTNVVATFNVAMSTSSLNDTTSFIVSGSVSGRHRGSFSFSGGNTIATFNPTNDFKNGEVVTVNVSSNVKDATNTQVKPFESQFTIATVPSTGTFATKVDYAIGIAPTTVFISDIDGDGDADVAVSNYNSNTVSILKNNGDGTLATKVDYTTGSIPYSVFISDVDSDGDGDLIVPNATPSTVSILKNNGDGTFAAKVDYETGSYPTYAFVDDLDGDGDGDIAVVNNVSNTVSILKNNGNGTFATKVDYAAGSNPYSLFIRDIDGDGDDDIAVMNYNSNTCSIFKNNGDGTFATKVDYATGTGPAFASIGDVDGDGDGDLAVTNRTANTVSIFKNNGNGTFTTKVDYTTGSYPEGVYFSDIDGDGDGDLSVANSNLSTPPGIVSILKNDGNGIFATKVDYTTGTGPHFNCVADMDGDGDGDLVVPNYDSNTLSILKNIGLGISGVKFNDLDGDGVKDNGEPGIANWKINITGAQTDSTYTDANGGYSFTALSNGSYTISEESKANWVQTFPGSGTYSLSYTGTSLSGKDFGNFKRASISGQKFSDINSDGIKNGADSGLANWRIRLTKNSVQVDSMLTDESGNYSFTNLIPGTYVVSEELQLNWVQTLPPSGSYTLTIISGDSLTEKDFGNHSEIANSITIRKYRDGDGDLDTPNDRVLKSWKLSLYQDSISESSLLE
ncbi:MAG: VCBS repeat-containing protein, partial [Ignavibacteriales bacterium]|nr:VCBS repeat-containing protein [Ignavibacteriales bacterium]